MLKGLRPGQVVVLLDEGKDIAFRMAAKAVEETLLVVDGKAGSFLAMKRTKRFIALRGRYQSDAVLRDNVG